MSSPIRNNSADDRLTYAPPWARTPARRNDNTTGAQDAPREMAPRWDAHADHPDDAPRWDAHADHPDDAPRWDTTHADHPDDAPRWDTTHADHPDDAPRWDMTQADQPDDASRWDMTHADHPDDAPRWDMTHADHPDDAPPWDALADHPDDAPQRDARADHPDHVPRREARASHAENPPQRSDGAAHPRDLDLPEARPVEIADAPATLPRAADPVAPRRNAPARPFEGDVAMRELRTRLTLDPHLVPEPPPEKASGSALMRVVRFFGIGALAAGTAYVVVLLAFPEARRPAPDTDDGAFAPAVVASKKTDRVVAPVTTSHPPVQLALVENRRATVNELVPLGIALSEPLDQGTVIVSGLAAGMRVSAGTVSGSGNWRVPLPGLEDAAVEPPADFVGVVDLAVELRAADETVMDQAMMRIEWERAQPSLPDRTQGPARSDRALALAAPPPRASGTPLDREEIAILLKRGRSFIAEGDLSSARLLLRRAAEAGDARAALLLGSTYDPSMFREWGVVGSTPDPEQALRWYQRAAELGSDEATRRLEPLASDAQ